MPKQRGQRSEDFVTSRHTDDQAKRQRMKRLLNGLVRDACESIRKIVRETVLEALREADERRIAEEASEEWKPEGKEGRREVR
jgi:hypothetical protein